MLSPEELKDFADLAERWEGSVFSFPSFLRQEAARREAEAKPTTDCAHVWKPMTPSSDTDVCDNCGVAREGPGSAAAPTEPVICTVCLMPAKWGDECRSFPCPYPKRPVEDKPTPAADELVMRLRKRGPEYADQGSASVCVAPADHDALEAADRIEAQAREIVARRNERDDWIHQAHAHKFECDTLKARVAELEKERGNIHASYEAERRMHHAAGDKLARLSAALKRIGKTYGANYARLIHSETQIKEIVEAALAEAPDAG